VWALCGPCGIQVYFVETLWNGLCGGSTTETVPQGFHKINLGSTRSTQGPHKIILVHRDSTKCKLRKPLIPRNVSWRKLRELERNLRETLEKPSGPSPKLPESFPKLPEPCRKLDENHGNLLELVCLFCFALSGWLFIFTHHTPHPTHHTPNTTHHHTPHTTHILTRHHTTPYHTPPHHHTPYHTAPHHTTPHHTTSHTTPHHTPHHTQAKTAKKTRHHTTPCHTTPHHPAHLTSTKPHHTTPHNTIPHPPHTHHTQSIPQDKGVSVRTHHFRNLSTGARAPGLPGGRNPPGSLPSNLVERLPCRYRPTPSV
jgi:hypothetical protein